MYGREKLKIQDYKEETDAASSNVATPSPHKIGIIGLGSGCIAAYAKPEDIITYFEIDPDNEKIAHKWFTYLDDCRGKVDVVAGDGRLSILKNRGNID